MKISKDCCWLDTENRCRGAVDSCRFLDGQYGCLIAAYLKRKKTTLILY